MNQSATLAIASFTVLEAVRTRVLWLILGSLAGGFGLAEFLGGVAVTESMAVKTAVLGAMLRLFAVFIMALFVAGSMVRELNDKGLELALSLPIPRAVYYVGKLLGFSLVALTTAILIGVCLLIYAPPEQVLIWTVSLACELLIVTALSLLCLFTFHHTTTALSAVAAFYLLARSIGAMQLMGRGPLVDPNSIAQTTITKMIDAIALVLPDLNAFGNSEWLVYHSGEFADLGPIAVQSLIYLLLLTGAGLFDLYRKSL